ncbi:MAG: hypothetical protein HY534_06835 [Chloroflexi bacterium]|nr:hypothetical protein [Chloroflexota bacterium]
MVATLAAFAIAAAVNTASVAVQQRFHFLTRTFGKNGWYVHIALIAPPWLAFLALLRDLNQRARWPLPESMRPLGSFLLVIASGLWFAAFRELGPVRVANGYFFGRGPSERVSGSVFRLRRDPMYDAYALALVGTAFRRANGVYLLLAVESLLLLNGLEASVENRAFANSQHTH